MVYIQSPPPAKHEVSRLARLNQQLYNSAVRDAEANVETVTKLKDKIRGLERQLAESKHESAQYQSKLRKQEQESADRQTQLDQLLVKQKMYDVPVGVQGVSARQLAAMNCLNTEPAAAPAKARATEEDRRHTVVRVLQARMQGMQEKADEQDREIERLTRLLDKTNVELSTRVRESQAVYGALQGGAGSGDATPPTAMQALHAQLHALHHELAETKAELDTERERTRASALVLADHTALQHQHLELLDRTAELQAALDAAAAARPPTPPCPPPLSAASTQTDASVEVYSTPAGAHAHKQGTASSLSQAAGGTGAALDVAVLVSDKAVMQRQLEILGEELLAARADAGEQLQLRVALQGKVNAALRENAMLRERVPMPPTTHEMCVQADPAPAPPAPIMFSTAVNTDLEESEDAKLQRVSQQKVEMELALREISDDRDTLQLKLNDAAETLVALTEREAVHLDEIECLHARTRDLQQQASQQAARINTNETEFVQERGRVEDLEVKLRTTTEEKDALSRELLHAGDDFRQMLRENAYLSQQLQEVIAARDDLHAQLNGLTERVNEAEFTMRAKEEEAAEVMASYRQLCDEQGELQRRLQVAEGEIHRAKDDVFRESRTVEELKHEIQVLTQKEQQAMVDLQSANFEIDAVNKKLLTAINERHAVQREVDDATRRLNGLQNVLDTTERRVIEAERERVLAVNELSHVRQQMQDVQGEAQAACRALTEEQRENRALLDNLSTSRKQEASLFNRSETVRADLETAQASARDLQRQVLDLQHELDTAKRAKHELAAAHQEMENMVAVLRQQHAKAEESERMLKDANTALIRQYEAAQTMLEVQDEEIRSMARVSPAPRSQQSTPAGGRGE